MYQHYLFLKLANVSTTLLSVIRCHCVSLKIALKAYIVFSIAIRPFLRK